jgi:hypothetical protein
MSNTLQITNKIRPYGVEHYATPTSRVADVDDDVDALLEGVFGTQWGDPIVRWGAEVSGDGMAVAYELLYPGSAAELQAKLEDGGAEGVSITERPVSPIA